MPTQVNCAGAVGTNSWNTPANAVGCTIDGNCAVHAPPAAGNWNTFGFTVPAGMSIQGILVQLVESNLTTGTSNFSVTLRKSDAGTDSSARTFTETTTANCGATQPTRNYGGSSDLWGFTWSPTEINSSGFTVRVTTTNASGPIAAVNIIQVTVTYTTAVTAANKKNIAAHVAKPGTAASSRTLAMSRRIR